MRAFLDLVAFARERKKFVLLPVIVLLLLLGALTLASQGTIVSPFVYALF